MIKEIERKDIEAFVSICKKEGLSFPKKAKVVYYGYYMGYKLVGFVGVIFYRDKAVLKNDYVLSEYRNRGIYSKLNEHRMQKIKEKGIFAVEGNFTDKALALHLKRGAKVKRKYKICTKVAYTVV